MTQTQIMHVSILPLLLLWFYSPECHMPHKTTPKKPIMVPAWNPEAEENSSASVYFSCVSSANKLTPIEKDGKANKRWALSLGRRVS
jgi:hypothetical protein